MSSSSKVLGLIPARKGSKRIPSKNIKLLCGTPLINYTIAEAKECDLMSRLIVSTDSTEIADLAKEQGVEIPFIRPEEFASDTATDYSVIKHAVDALDQEGWHADYVVILRPTQPLRTKQQIAEAVELLVNSEFTSVRSLSKVQQHPYWMKVVEGKEAKPFIDLGKQDQQLRSQDLPNIYCLNGVVDVINTKNLSSDSLYGTRMGAIILDSSDVVDIDTLDDFYFAEYLLNHKHKNPPD